MKIIYGLLLLSVSFCFQSCLHDEKDIFDKSASERMEKAVTVDQQMLESSTNGWVLNYYPGDNYSGGGYVYLIKFKNSKATVSSDFTGSDSTFTSDYAMVKDQGPVLTFNTYNPIMHHFGEATADNINSDHGDYEFVVDKATKDSIIMTGKRWGNKMVLTRLPENTKWSAYLDSVATMVDSLACGTFKYMDGNDSVANISLDPDTRIASITTNGVTFSASYVPTTKGLSFVNPVRISNNFIKDFVWNEINSKLNSTSASNISLIHYYPTTYHKIFEYEGTYNLYYYDDEMFTFTLTTNASKSGLKAHSDVFPFDFTFTYSKVWGTLSVTTQDLGPYNDADGGSFDNVQLCPDSNVSGMYTWGVGYGMNLVEVPGRSFYFNFVDNGKWSSYVADSFLFVSYRKGARVGALRGLPQVQHFVKIN